MGSEDIDWSREVQCREGGSGSYDLTGHGNGDSFNNVNSGSGFSNGNSGYNNDNGGFNNGNSGYNNGNSGYNYGNSGYNNGNSGYNIGFKGNDRTLSNNGWFSG